MERLLRYSHDHDRVIRLMLMNEDGELSPEMLEMVNGGGKFGTLVLLGVLAFASAYVGHPEGTIICIIAGIAYLKYGK